MSMPRVSIGQAMALVALVAADFAAYQAIRDQSDRMGMTWHFILLGLMPVVNALAVAGWIAASQVRRSGSSGPFAAGFGVGCLAGVVLMHYAWLLPEPVLWPFGIATRGTVRAFAAIAGRGSVSWGQQNVTMSFLYMAVLAPWPLLSGLAGGLLARRLGLRVVVDGRGPAGEGRPSPPGLAVSG